MDAFDADDCVVMTLVTLLNVDHLLPCAGGAAACNDCHVRLGMRSKKSSRCLFSE